MSDHVWAQENLDAFLAGGLSTEERERLEAHVAGCDACVSALAAAQKLDRTLAGLFAPVRPDAALEDRAIQKLRTRQPRRLSRWSRVARFVGAAAAIVVMGGLGVIVQSLVADGGLPFPGLERSGRTNSTSSLKQIGVDLLAFLDDPPRYLVKENYDGSVPRDLEDRDLDRSGVEWREKASPITEGQIGLPPRPVTSNADPLVRMEQGLIESKNGRQSHDEIRRFWMIDQPPLLTPYKITGGVGADGKRFNEATPMATEGVKGKESNEGWGVTNGAGGGRKAGGAGGVAMGLDLRESDGEYYGRSQNFTRPAIGFVMKAPTPALPALGNTPPPPPGRPSNTGEVTGMGGIPPVNTPSLPSSSPLQGKSNAGYYKPGDVAILAPAMGPTNADDQAARAERARIMLERGVVSKEDYEAMVRKPDNSVRDQQRVQSQSDLTKVAKKIKESGSDQPDALSNLEPPVVAQPPKQPELDVSRKIIRTGELEFEIDSFDKSVATIADLINKVKGGFVATVNSDKLPNGKVRGSVVVRMPPQFLDKFLLDLRKELGKVGELKTQRIGSQDVTKAYTDIESRLRAARTMEERFLAIIKGGKGEVKDLIAAEKELGVWRTKIEEMEGEIRYYNNQVGLSTLTITLTEKEIQAAAAVVITERVGMRIEVEDVEKAHIDALKAVAEEKGRITKSELKQHPAGQLEAALQVEVAPEKAKKLRDVFKKLGLVTFNDVQRVQQAVGGGKAGEFEGKLKQADVQIHVTLYDTANIQPRESVTMLIATDDVRASYRALQAAVAKAKGQIRVGQLREPEKITINAEFNFDVPTPEKPGIDAMLAKLGVILSSIDSQVPINETATDRKFGYRLVLRNLATVPARESSVLTIAVADVPKLFREVQDAVLAAKGIVQTRQLAESDKVNVRADLAFDVPKADKAAFDKVIEKLGMVLSTLSAQVADNVIATDRKFGYRLTLLNLASIKPRETITQQLAAKDVPASFRELQDAVVAAKGLIHVGQVNETDRLNITADFNFDVAKEERANIEKVLVKLGAVLTSSTSQVPLNEIASDKKLGFKIKLLNLASIRPREIFTLELVSNDVRGNFNELRDAVLQTKGVLYLDRLIEETSVNLQGRLDFDVASADKTTIDRLLAKSGAVLKRSNSQANVNELASDRKVGFRVLLHSIASVPPREKVTLVIKVDDVNARAADLVKQVRDAKGQASRPRITQSAREMNASLVFDVPLASEDMILRLIKDAGRVQDESQTQNPQVPDNDMATAQITVTLSGPRQIIPSDETFWSPIQQSLEITFRVFAWSVTVVILGLSVVLPWVIAIWLVVKIVRRMRGSVASQAS